MKAHTHLSITARPVSGYLISLRRPRNKSPTALACYEDIQSGQKELWGRQHLTDNDEAITGRREEEDQLASRRRWDGRRGKKTNTKK